MSTSMMIHDVKRIYTDGTVFYSNSNSVTLRIESTGFGGDHKHEITLFGLPTEAAEHLTRALSVSHSMSEDEIRADERRKIAAKLGL